MRLTLRASGTCDKYPAKVHSQRVADQLRLDNGLILLKGEKSAFYTNSDQPCPFRQERYFYYMTGCNEPGCYVTYDIAKDKLTLWIPPVDLTRVYYDGRGSTVEEAMEKYDIDEAVYLKGGKKGVKNMRLRLAEHAHAGGKFAHLKGALKDMGGQLFRTSLKDKKIRGSRLRCAMDSCRAVKDEHEIGLIREANAISAEAHKNIFKRLHGLTNEAEVEAVFIGPCIARRAREQAYTPICGAGTSASQLHYIDNKEDFNTAQTLLVDAGAEWQHYACDITRTMPINPNNPGHWASKEAAEVYKAVAKIQESSIKMLRPGKKFIDVNWHAHHMAIDSLLDLGILKGDHMEIFHAGTSMAFFPHGLGHHLGLEVHDVAPPLTKKKKDKKEGKKSKIDQRFRNVRRAYRAFSKVNLEFAAPSSFVYKTAKPEDFSLLPSQCLSPNTPTDPPLERGMVVTIEPGLYFNRFVLEKFFLHDETHSRFIDAEVLEKYIEVGGVRIEDDILITKDGYENLTTAPKGDKMLEIIKQGSDK